MYIADFLRENCLLLSAGFAFGYLVRSLWSIENHFPFFKSYLSKKAATGMMLSSSAKKIMHSGSLPIYVQAHFENSNKDSYLGLAIATDKIAMPLLEQYLQEACCRVISSCAGYDEARGNLKFRQAVSSFLSIGANREIDPDWICAGSGLSTVTETLFASICERGDGCLIPAPYFAGFDGDLQTRIGVHPIAVWSSNTNEGFNINATIDPRNLAQACNEAAANGIRVTALLLTNPHNPTGHVYDPIALKRAIEWACNQGYNVVVDEVYMGSVFSTSESHQFVSALSWSGSSEVMQQRVHVLYGFAKDFGVPGWRIGLLITENTQIRKTFQAQAHFSEAATLVLELGRQLLIWPGRDEYFKHRRAILKRIHDQVCAILNEYQVPHMPSQAGIFLMIDLRKLLDSPHTFDGELQLWNTILHETGINLTPGHSLHCQDPGYFRLCFASPDEQTVFKATKKLALWVHQKPQF